MSLESAGPIRVAITGLGRAGWNIHAQEVRKRKQFKLVAVVDQDQARVHEAAREFPGCSGFLDWKAFLDAPNGAELVVVATQNNLHGPMACDALHAGMHVLVEKPMALSTSEADRMIDVARQADRILTVHQNYRCDADLHQLLSIMNSGIVGRVFSIKSSRCRFARRNDWQTLRKYGGGTLNNLGAHAIDQCLQLLQSPVRDVWSALQSCITSGDAEDHVKVLIRGENDRVIDLEISDACAIEQPKWIVMGTFGSLIQQEQDFVIKYLDPDKLPKISVIDSLAVPDRKYGVVDGDHLEWQETRVPASPQELEVDFYQCLYESIRARKSLFVTPNSSRDVIQVIELAQTKNRIRN